MLVAINTSLNDKDFMHNEDTGLDEQGFIRNDYSVDKIQREFKPVVDSVVQQLTQRLPEQIDGIYLYGSIAFGVFLRLCFVRCVSFDHARVLSLLPLSRPTVASSSVQFNSRFKGIHASPTARVYRLPFPALIIITRMVVVASRPRR